MEVISASGAASLGAHHSVRADQAMLRLCGGYFACTVASYHPTDLNHNHVLHGFIFLHNNIIVPLPLFFGPPLSFIWASCWPVSDC